MKRKIRIWPDAMLRQVAKPIKHVDDDIRALAQDLLDTSCDEAGLAAPQIGVSKRIFVAQVDWLKSIPELKNVPKDPLVCINPTFVHKEGSMRVEEACLSLPGESGFVNRAKQVVMEYTDLQGQRQRIEAQGYLAVCLQHEADHLDGKVWVDYQSRTKREQVRYNMLRLKQNLYRNEQKQQQQQA
ncbi:MAG: peptide deformylase [Myxococcota bacterium]